MAIVDWPTLPSFKPARMTWGASTPKSAWAGAYTGQTQSLSHFGDRLRVELSLPPCSAADAGAREAYLMSLASTGDWVRLGHFLRPVPAGLLRGNLVVDRSEPVGARVVRLRGGTTPKNLLASTQNFDDVNSWVRSPLVSITANTHAEPNGGRLTADTITDPSADSFNYIQQGFNISTAIGSTYIASVYLRKTFGGTSKTVAIEVLMTDGAPGNSFSYGLFNTDTGVELNSGLPSFAVEDGLYWRVQLSKVNTDGWSRCAVAIFPAMSAHGLTAFDVTQTGSCVAFGAQLEAGASMTDYETPTLVAGDIIGIGAQLVTTAYTGLVSSALTGHLYQYGPVYIEVPLAMPLRKAVTAGEAATWFKPTGNFQLRSDVSALTYLGGRIQDAIALQFVEAF